MSEFELDGPKRSKTSINRFEYWLKERCKKPVDVKILESEYQYLTGHEPRKIRQYLNAIESSGKIKLQPNGSSESCEWVGDIENKEPPKKFERRFNVETMRNELMPEEEDENATAYMQRRAKEKQLRIRNELRQKLRENVSE